MGAPNQVEQPQQPRMVEPRAPEPERHKLHHSYIWLGPVRALPAIIAALLVSGWSGIMAVVDAFEYGLGFGGIAVALTLVVLALVLLVGIAMGIYALAYRYIWYEFGESEFSFYSGIVSKKRVHVPYQKVQSVNEKASFLQRLAGVCTVAVDTAGGAENKAVTVPYVKRSSAERIRQELFLRKRLMDAGLSPAEADARVRALQAQQAWAQGQPYAFGFQPSQQPAVYAGGQPWPPAPPAQADSRAPAPAAWAAPAQAQPASSDPFAVAFAPDGNLLDIPAGILDDLRGAFGGQEVDTGKVSYEFGLSNKELVLAAVTGKSSFALVLVGVVCTVASGLSTLIDVRLPPGDAGFYSSLWGVAATGGPWLWAMMASGLLGVLLLIWVVSVVAACVSYGGFRACRRGERVEVERGIVSHEFTGIEVDRIQSIHIHQSFFQRLLRCCALSYGRVGVAAGDASDQGSSTVQSSLVVHPFLPLSRVPEVLAGLTPEYADVPEADRPVPPQALRRAVTRRAVLQGLGFWLAVVALAGYAVCMVAFGSELAPDDRALTQAGLVAVLVLAAVIFAAEAVDAVLWHRRAGFGFDARYVTVVNGGFSVDAVVLPRPKIQLACVRTNPLQRHARTATLIAVSAAGVGGKKERLIDVSETDAYEWLMWTRPRPSAKV